MRLILILILILILTVVLLGIGGCGGASHSSSTTHTSTASPERARLLSELRSGLEDPTSPVANVRDLDECIVEQAKPLPPATLRKLVSANPGAAVADPLVARCVAQGKGLSWVRGTIAGVVSGKFPPPIPAAFSRCVTAGVRKLTPAQLAASLNGSAVGDQSYSRRLGRQIALDCIKEPPVFKVWRKLWVADIRRSLNGRHLPSAFVRCVIDKAAKIGATELVNLVEAGSAAESAYGEKLGRACRPSLTRTE